MKKKFLFLVLAAICLEAFTLSHSEEVSRVKEFTKSKDFDALMPVKKVKRIEIDSGYHEGIAILGDTIILANGKGGNLFVVDKNSGKKISEIIPLGTFTEAITFLNAEECWVSDWDLQKIYKASLMEGRLEMMNEISFAPSYPAGIIWNGTNLYMITWTRGAGTKYHLVKMDRDGNVIERALISMIPEPSQMAWDGKYLWITSWFDRRAYMVDIDTYEVKGYFRTEIEKTTGIAWDRDIFWLTGTNSALYQFKNAGQEERK